MNNYVILKGKKDRLSIHLNNEVDFLALRDSLVEKVKEAAKDLEFKAPEGTVKISGENQHLWKTVRIGEVQPDGSIKEIWSTPSPVEPDPYLKSYSWAQGLNN